MTDDLAELLRSADGGPTSPDVDDITSRGRRLQVVRATAVVAAAVIVVAGGAGIVAGLAGGPAIRNPVIGEPDPAVPSSAGPSAVEEPTTPGQADPQLEPQSQSFEDAARDGVIDEVAVLPLDLRMRSAVGSGEYRIETEEGIWMASRLDLDRVDPPAVTVGDESGRYGRDWFGVSGYGEILLLNHDETEILRAYPFPDAGPQALLVTDDAVYCARAGDGGLPDSMLCRIDRESLQARVRVFPRAAESHFLDEEAITLPDTWTVEEPYPWNTFGQLELRGGTLYSIGQDGSAPFDPVTLELLDAASDEPGDPTAADRQLIDDFLAFADTAGPATAAPLPFAGEVAIGLGPDLHRTLTGRDLADPAAWDIDVPLFRAYTGPFSPLAVAAEAGPVEVSVGDHPHCASPPQPAPTGLEDLRRVSAQPAEGSYESCLQWWTVDLFVDGDGDIAAVTMDLYEP